MLNSIIKHCHQNQNWSKNIFTHGILPPSIDVLCLIITLVNQSYWILLPIFLDKVISIFKNINALGELSQEILRIVIPMYNFYFGYQTNYTSQVKLYFSNIVYPIFLIQAYSPSNYLFLHILVLFCIVISNISHFHYRMSTQFLLKCSNAHFLYLISLFIISFLSLIWANSISQALILGFIILLIQIFTTIIGMKYFIMEEYIHGSQSHSLLSYIPFFFLQVPYPLHLDHLIHQTNAYSFLKFSIKAHLLKICLLLIMLGASNSQISYLISSKSATFIIILSIQQIVFFTIIFFTLRIENPQLIKSKILKYNFTSKRNLVPFIEANKQYSQVIVYGHKQQMVFEEQNFQYKKQFNEPSENEDNLTMEEAVELLETLNNNYYKNARLLIIKQFQIEVSYGSFIVGCVSKEEIMNYLSTSPYVPEEFFTVTNYLSLNLREIILNRCLLYYSHQFVPEGNQKIKIYAQETRQEICPKVLQIRAYFLLIAEVQLFDPKRIIYDLFEIM